MTGSKTGGVVASGAGSSGDVDGLAVVSSGGGCGDVKDLDALSSGGVGGVCGASGGCDAEVVVAESHSQDEELHT
jgi:hypothetical protein